MSSKNVTVQKSEIKQNTQKGRHLARALTKAVDKALTGVGAAGGAFAHLGTFLGSSLGSWGGRRGATARCANLVSKERSGARERINDITFIGFQWTLSHLAGLRWCQEGMSLSEMVSKLNMSAVIVSISLSDV